MRQNKTTRNTNPGTMTTDTRANRLILSRTNELIYDGKNVWVPIVKCATKDLETMLDAVGADMIAVQYRTINDNKAQAQDRKTFTRRLSKLSPRYVVSPFAPRVIDGHTIANTFVATINRVQVRMGVFRTEPNMNALARESADKHSNFGTE